MVHRPRRALVTGTAGFIGFHLARRLLADGWLVTGVDGMTPYYDVSLKQARHARLRRSNAFHAHEIMLEDDAALPDAFDAAKPDVVVHLAAQAGVRYSLENPRAYVDANLVGTFNVLEGVRRHAPAHFLLASTSSVYGANTDMPFAETDRTDHPLTVYAATKKATETMAHSYAHLWKLPTTAFRFFTVYGPWGRPDMALFKFVRAILAGEPIEIYGEGAMQRDFTYVDDLVEAIARLIEAPPVEGAPVAPCDSLSPAAPWRAVNIAGGRPVGLVPFVETIEAALGVGAKKILLPLQKGDVPATFARAELLEALTGYVPATPVEEGVRRFVAWYREHYGVPAT
ncbi:NAD-dependent epimerase/dehydratase family protein [Salinarimonas chemoclinalis]|uniref:NAD-dependent epimerase/dehydratase family protein n=1 Tax=Salinarimonas chemoclinalis TaxID=3241599 RepID=UPI003557720B